MKTKLLSLLCTSVFVAYTNAQSPTPAEVQGRSDTTERIQPAPISNDAIDSESNSDTTVSSDTGAQRPISLKKNGISGFFGYDSKYFYRSNPLATKSDAKQATGMWTNTFYTGAGLGVYDMDSYVVTPYIGASWTINDYVEGKLSSFNYNSTGAYALLLAQFGNGWSVRAGVSYAMDRSTEYDTEDYRDYVPNLGVMKAYSISPETTAVFDASVSTHNTEAFVLPGMDKSKLDNIEATASYGLNHKYGNLSISPKYKISFKEYDTGLNDGRDDLTHILSLKVDYPITESLKFTVFGGYSSRDANAGKDGVDYDYESYDAGAAIGLSARF
jgi:hypothetical protein